MTRSNGIATLMIALGLLAPTAASADVSAVLSPADPVVGVTKVTIAGRATAGATVVATSTFPDGTLHVFSAKADDAGAYRYGPFVLWQLGTYRTFIHDAATGATTTISYSGAGDFRIAVEKPSATILTGGEVRFKVTFTSVDGFGGEVTPQRPAASAVPSAVIYWSPLRLRVPPNGSATAILTILTLNSTPPNLYQVAVQGANGSVTHAVAPAIALTVQSPPPDKITATLSPDHPIVGVSEVRIAGQATAGHEVVDTSTFPDGVAHKFGVSVSGAGTYSDGPFVLRQLGTYHDVLLDSATGAKAEISYQGVGDFSTSVDRTSETVVRGEETKFQVIFKSLSGFAGAVTPAVSNLSRIAGATASWSTPAVTVRSGDSTAVDLTIRISSATPPGTYKINVLGANGSVTHTAPSEIELTVKE
jgi:hypothetical protein